MLTDSTPPATTTGTRSTMMRCAAKLAAWMPELHARAIVTPPVESGSPPTRPEWRAMLFPLSPSGTAQPKITSSTSAGSIPARATAWRIACPPIVALWVLLKAPRNAFARGVRAVETTTASVMWLSLNIDDNCRNEP
jgi:hypothetical protein